MKLLERTLLLLSSIGVAILVWSVFKGASYEPAYGYRETSTPAVFAFLVSSPMWLLSLMPFEKLNSGPLVAGRLLANSVLGLILLFVSVVLIHDGSEIVRVSSRDTAGAIFLLLVPVMYLTLIYEVNLLFKS